MTYYIENLGEIEEMARSHRPISMHELRAYNRDEILYLFLHRETFINEVLRNEQGRINSIQIANYEEIQAIEEKWEKKRKPLESSKIVEKLKKRMTKEETCQKKK